MWHWDDLKLFLAVARAGGLAGAVGTTGLSAPTLGRRMLSLERAMGVALFLRHRLGYDLTAAGRNLLALAEEFEQGALAIDRWRGAAETQPVVTIAAGAWTSAFVARHSATLVAPDEGMTLEIRTASGLADLTRRQANLGLRNRQPDQPGLAGQRLVRVAFAVYGARGIDERFPEARDERRYQACPWIAFAPEGPKVPTAVWLAQRSLRSARVRCSTAEALLEATRSGLGLAVLPCFIGDSEAGLMRVSDPIAELGHDQWLVSHDDDRHLAPIRRLSRRLAALLRAHKDLFEGRQPQSGAISGP